jgi:hypothetical protein
MARFRQLKRYKQVNGNCNVPMAKMHGTEYLHELAYWVEQQRTDFVLFVNSGKSCPLLQEHFDLLTGEGFMFVARSDVAWEPDYRKIQGFVKAHGFALP